jgi:hypothetical protein
MTLVDHSQKSWRETLLFALILPFFYQKIRAIMKGESKPSLEDRIRGELRRNTLRIDPPAEERYVQMVLRREPEQDERSSHDRVS